MKVDEDKLDVSFVIPRLGNFDPLASFGSPRNQQIIILLATSLFVYVLCFRFNFGLLSFHVSVECVCVCVLVSRVIHRSGMFLSVCEE
ncbi:hypothetical protein CARUB_v10002356mg [Capsella rubella]|uniref:Uncharacterized protein n=1 Tax=Capsella rubella TaxID=81985 RepID=R0HA57_9BRAS|nr:hypothetical protein CARUB_v10002356mg [Capsella rubella]